MIFLFTGLDTPKFFSQVTSIPVPLQRRCLKMELTPHRVIDRINWSADKFKKSPGVLSGTEVVARQTLVPGFWSLFRILFGKEGFLGFSPCRVDTFINSNWAYG